MTTPPQDPRQTTNIDLTGQNAGHNAMDEATRSIQWPENLQPAQAAVLVRNEVVIPAQAEVIWAWLLRAEQWPTWYPNSAHIHFLSDAGPDLRDRSRFRWRTFGARITSKVLEFEPATRLAWSSHGIGIDAYHAWVLTPLKEGGTRVVSQETQQGWRVRLIQRFMPNRAETQHQIWLEALSQKAQSGLPA